MKVELLRKLCNVKRVDGYTSFALERFLDLISVLLIALISALLVDAGSLHWWLPLLLMTIVCSLMYALYYVVTRYFNHNDLVISLKLSIDQLVSNPTVLIYTMTCSMVAWLIVVLGWMIFLEAIDVEISIVQGTLLTSGATLINIASFIPGAVGVSEVSISLMLQSFDVIEMSAQAGALLIRIYALYSILFGLFGAIILYVRVRPRGKGSVS